MSPRCKHRAGRSRFGSGFTLIEMLVAVTLMALIGIAVTDGLRLARRCLQTAVKADRDSLEIVAAQRFLRHAVESAEPAGSARLNGDSTPAGGVALEFGSALRGEGNRLTFRAAGPLSVNDGIPSVFEVRLVPRERETDQHDLVVYWRAQTADPGVTSDVSIPGEVLVSAVESVRWQYLPDFVSSNGTADGSVWLDDWQGRPDLPALIRLDVNFKPGSRRIWPPFIVQLHLTRDAGCVFDVVSQDCRKAE